MSNEDKAQESKPDSKAMDVDAPMGVANVIPGPRGKSLAEKTVCGTEPIFVSKY